MPPTHPIAPPYYTTLPSHLAPLAMQPPYLPTQRTLLLILTNPGTTANSLLLSFFGWWASAAVDLWGMLGTYHLLIYNSGHYRWFMGSDCFFSVLCKLLNSFFHRREFGVFECCWYGKWWCSHYKFEGCSLLIRVSSAIMGEFHGADGFVPGFRIWGAVDSNVVVVGNPR